MQEFDITSMLCKRQVSYLGFFFMLVCLATNFTVSDRPRDKDLYLEIVVVVEC